MNQHLDYLKQSVANEQWQKIIIYLELSNISTDLYKRYNLYTYLWKAHTKLNNQEKSIFYLKHSLDCDPENATLNRAYGDYFYADDKYDLAEKYFRKALENNREIAGFNLRLANTLLKKGKKKMP